MRLIIKPKYEDICQYVAQYIANTINAFGPTEEKPFVLGISSRLGLWFLIPLLGLPTGSSPIGVYKVSPLLQPDLFLFADLPQRGLLYPYLRLGPHWDVQERPDLLQERRHLQHGRVFSPPPDLMFSF